VRTRKGISTVSAHVVTTTRPSAAGFYEGESTGALSEYSDDHPPPEDFATNELEMLDPEVDDDQLQRQFYEND
jgi:hypothetical protein